MSDTSLFAFEELMQLDAQWRDIARNLMATDGTSLKFKDGGFDVKGDPALADTIIRIRDGYFTLFKQHITDSSSTELHNELLLHNAESYEQLMQQGLGSLDARRMLGLIIGPTVATFAKVDNVRICVPHSINTLAQLELIGLRKKSSVELS